MNLINQFIQKKKKKIGTVLYRIKRNFINQRKLMLMFLLPKISKNIISLVSPNINIDIKMLKLQ